ncbi:hypothetical protein M9H77_04896 [Catharanthus roseus]|uniref:Uncharacterized protein n=1 Tax=Catharanthus roseus TaxID=4058 RepID=A0ACC0CFX7_CATRO|nr:hypothetical protein M9H77_04896 [Catharanthus roseus]
MSSVSDTFNAASRVNLLQQPPPSTPSPTHRRNRNLIKFFFCVIIFLAMITGGILLFLVHKQFVKSRNEFNSNQSDAAVQVFCSVTLHLPECITSLSMARNVQKRIKPDEIFSFSLILAFNEVNSLASLTKSLIWISTDQSRSDSALQKCASLIDNSVDRLNRSVTASAVGYSFLDREKIRDIVVWINGSVSDLRICFDYLQEKDESRIVDELRWSVQKAMYFASNSFEFLENRDGIVSMIESWNYEKRQPAVDYEYLSLLCIFWPQYLVLFLLYFLLLRKY